MLEPRVHRAQIARAWRGAGRWLLRFRPGRDRDRSWPPDRILRKRSLRVRIRELCLGERSLPRHARQHWPRAGAPYLVLAGRRHSWSLHGDAHGPHPDWPDRRREDQRYAGGF